MLRLTHASFRFPDLLLSLFLGSGDDAVGILLTFVSV